MLNPWGSNFRPYYGHRIGQFRVRDLGYTLTEAEKFYAFRIGVWNPPSTPVFDMWTLEFSGEA